MLISMTGDASMYMLPHTAVTYEKAFYRGVEQMWEGSYMGKDVNVIIEKRVQMMSGSISRLYLTE